MVLGISLALGQFVGAAGIGFNVFQEQRAEVLAGIGSLYLANVVNAVIYDAVYAHQDLKDDLKAGVKSVAVAWQERTKPILSFLAALQTGLLCGGGYLLGFGSLYFSSAVIGTASVLGCMIFTVRLDVSESCWRWFKWTIWLTGGTLSCGLLLEHYASIQ